jgi:hypothetical protein
VVATDPHSAVTMAAAMNNNVIRFVRMAVTS